MGRLRRPFTPRSAIPSIIFLFKDRDSPCEAREVCLEILLSRQSLFNGRRRLPAARLPPACRTGRDGQGKAGRAVVGKSGKDFPTGPTSEADSLSVPIFILAACKISPVFSSYRFGWNNTVQLLTLNERRPSVRPPGREAALVYPFILSISLVSTEPVLRKRRIAKARPIVTSAAAIVMPKKAKI